MACEYEFGEDEGVGEVGSVVGLWNIGLFHVEHISKTLRLTFDKPSVIVVSLR